MPKRLPEYDDAAATATRSSRAALEGVGYLDLAGCLALGVTGPMLRVDRAAAGTCARPSRTAATRPTTSTCRPGDTGDAYGRFLIRLDEMRESLQDRRAVRRPAGKPSPARSWSTTRRSPGRPSWSLGADGMGNSPRPHPHIMGESMEALIHHFKLVTEGFRVPAGPGLRRRSSRPRGELGAHVVSDGGTRPYRVHFRDPSFTNLQAIAAMCEGGMVADVIVAIASHRPRDGRSGPVMPIAATRSTRATPTRDEPTPARDHRPLPAGRARRCCRCCTWCSPRRATSPPDGHRVLRRACSASPRPRSPRSRPSTRCTSAARSATTTSASAPTRCARCMGGDAIFDRLQRAPRRRQRRDHRRRHGSPSSTSSATRPATTRR